MGAAGGGRLEEPPGSSPGPGTRCRAGTTVLLALARLHGCSAAERRPTLAADDPLWAELDAELRAFVEEQALPGLSVAVLSGEEVVFARGYGRADREQGVPVRADTRFAIGSVEKQFTAAVSGAPVAGPAGCPWRCPVAGPLQTGVASPGARLGRASPRR